MSSRTPDDEVVGLLQSLREATSDEQPSPDVEARLLEAFGQRRAASCSGAGHPWVARRRSVARVPVARWLAVAASVAFVVAAVGGIRAWWTAGANRPMATARWVERQHVPLASRALQPDMDRSVAPSRMRSATASRAVAVRGNRTSPPADVVEFVAWPGAVALPSLESGELVRTELPASVIPLLGLQGAVRAGRTAVPADVIVGQDGRPRAVRLVSDER